VFLLESMSHSRELESSLKNKNQSLDLMEREGEELKIWISRETLLFSEWPTALGGGWESIYSSYLKRAIGGSFHRTSLVWHQTSPIKLSSSRSRPDKSGHEHLEAGVVFLEANHKSD
jgi:hypothetical protein